MSAQETIPKLLSDSFVHTVPLKRDSIFMIDLYVMRRLIGTTKDEIPTESLSAFLRRGFKILFVG